MENKHTNLLIACTFKKMGSEVFLSIMKNYCNVEIAHVYNNVIKKVKENNIDVLIIDLELPGIKGCEIEMLSALKIINPELLTIIISEDLIYKIPIKNENVIFYNYKTLNYKDINLNIEYAMSEGHLKNHKI